MTFRKLPAVPGGRAWIDCTSSPEAAPGWPNGLAVTVVACVGARVTVRDGTGRDLTLPHDSLDTGYEYPGLSGRVPETDARVVNYLHTLHEAISREDWDQAIDRYRADVIANVEAIVSRNTLPRCAAVTA
ncbi:MAG: hypothetical protein QOE70_6197 [Chthoniobacter sp.]|jgi:hypothetical protein|nr:hypothetical protein [Chthoniobacter sp.]